jgi:activator of HSP90 ATPase
VKDLVRSKILPQLRTELQKLAPALIAEHGKDLQHATGSSNDATKSNTTTTSSHINHSTAKASQLATTTSKPANKAAVNTTTVVDNEEFQTTAAELYQTFTDAQRIAAFTRSPPRVFEGAKEGGRFELFDGNVSGEYTELVEPTKIVQRWRLKQWPEGHYSQLAIKFDQNDQDGVTVMRVNWDGVPIGQEEVTKRNWREYYVRCIKTTFG